MKRKPKFDQILFECQYVAALKAVDAYFKNEVKAEIWLQTKNPLLGDVSPVHMIKVGRFDKLIQFIYDRISEDRV
jgi:uncharacterized protein (DUF2384 family)